MEIGLIYLVIALVLGITSYVVIDAENDNDMLFCVLGGLLWPILIYAIIIVGFGEAFKKNK